MKTIEKDFISEIEVKKSTFIAHLTDIKDFEALHVKLQNTHPKANHIVWAKRYLNEFNQIVENSSDDGEPKGTSGPPVLNVMRGRELIECGILIVRYFGGTKLGTGGLVRAYGGAAKDVIESASLVPYVKKENIKFSTIYALVPRFEHFLEKEGLLVKHRTYESNSIVWELDLSQVERENFLDFAKSFERDGFNLKG